MNSEGLKTNPEKIRPIFENLVSTNLKQLRGFLGMTIWYSRFVNRIAEYKASLNKLNSKRAKWYWGLEQQQVENCNNGSLHSCRPNFELPFTLQTDTSDYAIAIVLMQEGSDGREHPIYYVSRTLREADKNYTVTEKECLRILGVVERSRDYLQSTRIKMITDHYSLLRLNNLKGPTGKLARGNTALSAYNIEFVHRKGIDHEVPDAFSIAYENELAPDITAINFVEIDLWYAKRQDNIEGCPYKYLNWTIQDGLIYHYCPNDTLDPPSRI